MARHESAAFITVEGPDGAGKTTQIAFIARWLKEQDIPVQLTREPGGTALGEQLRDLLLNRNSLSIADETELLLMFAARQQHINEIILPHLNRGNWVLCDRFTDASYAYQGAGRGIPAERIRALENWVQGDLQPDLTLVLDIDVALGIRRSGDRNGDRNNESDRFEQQGLGFKQAVRDGYLQRARAEPGRMKVIDAGLDLEPVQRQIVVALGDFVTRFGAAGHE